MTNRAKHFNMAVGDWVSGTTLNDERIRGYVNHFDPMTSIYAVTVVESDRKEAVGRIVFASQAHLTPLAENVRGSKEALLAMIDLALAARDEAWFYELTAELLALEAQRGATAATA